MKKFMLLGLLAVLVSCGPETHGSKIAQVERLESVGINNSSNSEHPYVYTDKGGFVYMGKTETSSVETTERVFNLSINKDYCVIHYATGEVYDMIEPDKCVERNNFDEQTK